MKALPVISSPRLRYGVVMVVAAAVCTASLSACGGSTATNSPTRREVSFHIHHEERLRKLEARLRQVKKQTKKSHVVPVPYVPSGEPSTGTGTYYTPAPAESVNSGSCGGELSVNSYTSCPFAANVEEAYFSEIGSGPGEVVAYSPVTDRTYVMSCTGSHHECTGGDDAAVYFP